MTLPHRHAARFGYLYQEHRTSVSLADGVPECNSSSWSTGGPEYWEIRNLSGSRAHPLLAPLTYSVSAAGNHSRYVWDQVAGVRQSFGRPGEYA
jgi:hypothetical protein